MPTTSFGQPGELLGVGRSKAEFQLGYKIDILLGVSVSACLGVVNQQDGLDNLFAPNLWIMKEKKILKWEFSSHPEKILDADEVALIPVRPVKEGERGGVLVAAVKDLRTDDSIALINVFLEHPTVVLSFLTQRGLQSATTERGTG